ncbi:hypothetical protein DESUT3_36100 [Desulfuromonas versatilis]|uniref:NIF system FeS cluster assembly NifU N-terminal domain-containing protein n=1 Tax=Desulfuromonas versatilis TaxID=2802975 RepID=A0ABM8I0N2_9BACT|nr:nitrogen fixation protein NifQ [Desulfuromonas versatilis]BCR06541.1 hypothetical protein DESUT3_36100 [Desulfuromonas versatilis]
MTGYTDTILRWAADTRRAGELPEPDGVGEVGLEAGEAGRRLAVRFAIRTREGRVADLRFQVFGCGFTIAACAVAAELAVGHTLEEALAISPARVDAVLEGLPNERGYCAELAVEALHGAVESARAQGQTVQADHRSAHPDEHGPLLDAEDPLYRALMRSAAPEGVAREDRHLFACLLAVAAQEPHGLASSLGLSAEELEALRQLFFPGFDPALLPAPPENRRPAPEINPEILEILLSHVPGGPDEALRQPAAWLARIIAARAAHPGHLWVAMGLFERPELSAAIRRLLPSLAAANDKGMRWKRYLFKQVCERHGSQLCKSPNCGVCSDYALCFAPE